MTKRQEAAFGVCKMCGRRYSLDGEVAGVLGQLAPGEDMSGLIGQPGGKDIELDLCGLPVSAMLVAPDSPARQQGFDVLFLVCSWDCVAAIRLAAEVDASSDGHDVDPNTTGVYWLRLWKPEQLMTARSLEKLELFESKLRSILPDVAKRIGCDRSRLPAEPHDSAVDLATIQELLDQTCAWCLHAIDDDRQRLLMRMKDDGEAIGDGGGAVFKVGERIVPAERVEPGSPESAKGNAVFHLCSKACASDLRAAISRERRLRVVH